MQVIELLAVAAKVSDRGERAPARFEPSFRSAGKREAGKRSSSVTPVRYETALFF